MTEEVSITFHQRRIWQQLHHLPEFDHAAVIERGATRSNVAAFIERWIRIGLVEFVRKAGKNRIYRPVRKASAEACEATPRGSMWRTMRLLGTFTAKDVAIHSNTSRQAVSYGTATNYCALLASAGILRKVKRSDTKNKATTYRLIRNLGPLPPEPARINCLKDPNADAVYFGDQRIEL